MNKQQKMRFALAILVEAGHADGFDQVADEDRLDKADKIIERALTVLAGQANSELQRLLELGFSNKEIADRTDLDPAVLSKIHSRHGALEIALDTLQAVGKKLNRELCAAKVERVKQSTAATSLVAIDFCRNGGAIVSDLDKGKVSEAVLMNLIHALTGNTAERIPLPPNTHGALVRIGPPEHGLVVYQSEGQNDAERLAHEIHELEHLLNRKKDELGRMAGSQKAHASRRQRRSAY